MKTLVLNSETIRSLPSHGLKQAMAQSLIELSRKNGIYHPRYVVELKQDGVLGFMPSACGDLFGYKIVSVFSNNGRVGLNPHQGLVALLDFNTGQIKCLLDGATITALRTAAVSAVATDLLSRQDSTTLTLIGAGLQALEHALAIAQIRPLRKIVIFNRTQHRAEQLVERLALQLAHKIDFLIVDNPEDAVKDADIVVTCTNSSRPILKSHDFKPGVHINAVGACRPGYREIELQSDDHIKIFLDSVKACGSESSEISDPQRFDEIGSCLGGHCQGRTSESDITLFKSVGLGIQDLFAADYYFNQAKKQKCGYALNVGEFDE